MSEGIPFIPCMIGSLIGFFLEWLQRKTAIKKRIRRELIAEGVVPEAMESKGGNNE